MQGSILNLLLQCTVQILHDIGLNGILEIAVAVEPPLSDIPDRDEGQANFIDI
jgi:hypothetical protein